MLTLSFEFLFTPVLILRLPHPNSIKLKNSEDFLCCRCLEIGVFFFFFFFSVNLDLCRQAQACSGQTLCWHPSWWGRLFNNTRLRSMDQFRFHAPADLQVGNTKECNKFSVLWSFGSEWCWQNNNVQNADWRYWCDIWRCCSGWQ